ncbi:hybrid sensor histidine kinase/response regulator [Undibacterium fentianense]|uniref:Sensory/regulatory protein RpfC n=1 Tax=Undibacterium fentianense TaxID=2828728 RepID=A0A941IEW8_9BURK|nr:response regulator [Undibacterium fentianense]MBR7799817.1 response regulator [Undibacterium fentianense]
MRTALAFLRRLLPSSLTNRVFALYSISLLFFVSAGLFLFLRFHFQLQIEQSEEASVMVVEVVAQAVQDSVIIGDYDTVRKTLDKGVQGSVFASAAFIDLAGGVVDVKRTNTSNPPPPLFIVNWVNARLHDVNRTITVGGKDYGVLRLRFDTFTVAQDLWSLSLLVISVAIFSLLGGLVIVRFPLQRWLGGLERLRGMLETLGTPGSSVVELDTRHEPSEIQKLVDMFNKTAYLVREREATRRALDDQKFALDQHAIVSITDLDGKIIYANDKFCEITEYSQEELIGKNHRIIQSGFHSSDFFVQMWDTICAGKVWRGEICNRKRGGALYWVSATIVPLLDAQGKPHQFIAIRTDITESKNAQQLILQAKEAAETANRVKSDFLANMSHEIRTPMNGIIGMTELALDTDLNTEQREYINLVKVSAVSLLQIVNDILDFSKIEAGKMEIDKVSFSLESLLSTTLKTLSTRIEQAKLELLLDIAADVPQYVIGDPGRLKQVITNLVGNAIKFTETGEVVLSVRLAPPTDGEKVQIYFEVQDTGIGIAREKFDLIFKAFSQADTSTTRQYGGTGLGLSISAQLVKLMGGEIGLDSELKRGSRFYFTIPFHFDPSQDNTAPLELTQLRGQHILIIDDHLRSRDLLTRQLQEWDVRTTVVSSANEALQLLQRSASQASCFDCVLIDAQMPIMDGFQLAESMQAFSARIKQSIMLITSEKQQTHIGDLDKLGIKNHLLKPISRSELYAAILTTNQASASHQSLQTTSRFKKNRKPLHILLAEDNLVNQTLTIRLLEKLGHTIQLAENGSEAVRHFQEGYYDAILMDVDMPLMNGYKASQRIRQLEQHSHQHTPIIALTAHAIEGSKEACLQHGMDAYLSKPIDVDALWRELEKIHHVQPTITLSASPDNMYQGSADLNKMREMIGNDRELFNELSRLFALDAHKHLTAIQTGIAAGDFQAIRQGAHSIKGMAGVFYAESIKQSAIALERTSDLTQAPLLLEQLQRLIANLEQTIAQYHW